MKCKNCKRDLVLRASIYDREEQKLYCDWFDHMVDLKTHLAIRNMNMEDVLVLRQVHKPN